MSPFGSHAMLQGLRKPSATVTALNRSPGGPGGCANAEIANAAAPTSTAARADAPNFDVAFMNDSFV
jgi:hypothetical protein